MNDEIYSRLEGLMKSLGLSVNNGSFTKAEMKAYAAGIGLAQEKMKKAMNNVFIDTADEQGTAMFLSMVKEKPAVDTALSKAAVINAVADNPGIYSKSYFDAAVKENGGASYTMAGNVMQFSCGSADFRTLLEMLSKQITDVNPCTVVINGNAGKHFDKWDAAALRWFELDRLELPFITLDGIK